MEETITPLGACIFITEQCHYVFLRSAAEHFQRLRSRLCLAGLKNAFGDCLTPVPAAMERVKRVPSYRKEMFNEAVWFLC